MNDHADHSHGDDNPSTTAATAPTPAETPRRKLKLAALGTMDGVEDLVAVAAEAQHTTSGPAEESKEGAAAPVKEVFLYVADGRRDLRSVLTSLVCMCE